MYYIYELVDPRTGKAHYVGITNISPDFRLKQHISESHHDQAGGRNKKEWIQELLALGLTPQVNTIEEIVDQKEAFDRERHWIRTYADRGIELTNARHIRKHKPQKPREPEGPSPHQQWITNNYYTKRQACELLGISATKFDKLIKERNVHGTTIVTSRMYYPKIEIDWLSKTTS